MYKIKFLDELLWNKEQTDTTPVFKTQFFSDADLPEITKLWQILPGLKRVDEIDLVENKNKKEDKLSVLEVIEAFYPDELVLQNGEKKLLSDHDKKQKTMLIEKYSVKTEVDDGKAYRAEMRTKLKDAGLRPANNATTEDLEKMINELPK
jgi:hypothetical protein